MQLAKHGEEWEEMAGLDPLWAILSAPDRQFNRWDYDAFLLTGAQEVDALMTEARSLGRPAQWNRALDFGCGVGRLTRALRRHFPECHGVDISARMVCKAREIAPDCIFHVNTTSNLKDFDDSYFDFVYSMIVLQHQPNRSVVLNYIGEFLRILAKDGLLVFQLPSYLPLRTRVQARRRLYTLLHSMGWKSDLLYRRLKLAPIRMLGMPEKDVVSAITRHGGKVIEVHSDKHAGQAIQSKTYYVSR